MNKEVLIHKTLTVKDALKQLDRVATKTLLVVDDDNKLIGAVTDGDIRRYILKGKDLDNYVDDVYNSNPVSIRKKVFILSDVKQIMLDKKIELIPIVDDSNKVVDYITWEKAFSSDFEILNGAVGGCCRISCVNKDTGKKPVDSGFTAQRQMLTSCRFPRHVAGRNTTRQLSCFPVRWFVVVRAHR